MFRGVRDCLLSAMISWGCVEERETVVREPSQLKITKRYSTTEDDTTLQDQQTDSMITLSNLNEQDFVFDELFEMELQEQYVTELVFRNTTADHSSLLCDTRTVGTTHSDEEDEIQRAPDQKQSKASFDCSRNFLFMPLGVVERLKLEGWLMEIEAKRPLNTLQRYLKIRLVGLRVLDLKKNPCTLELYNDPLDKRYEDVMVDLKSFFKRAEDATEKTVVLTSIGQVAAVKKFTMADVIDDLPETLFKQKSAKQFKEDDV